MLFQNTIIKKYLAVLNDDEVKAAWEKYKALFLNQRRQDNILVSKEEEYQDGFLRDLFVAVLGYTLKPDLDYNLTREKKNETDSKKADGAIQRDGIVIGVIELKDHKTPNLAQVEAQAFGYKNRHKGTRYVIISNFEKLRFFIDDATDFKEWDLFSLKEEDFRELYFCLSWSTLSKDLPIKAKTESVSNEDKITQQLYHDYSTFKRELFADILQHNTTEDTPKEQILLLFKKTQKLLDRLLFIFFAEDCELLPPNMMIQIINEWEQLKALDVEIPLYTRIKQYFGYLDTGNDKKNIYAYNGGLFKPDEELDALTISDELLALHTKKLSEYDYASEVDVNILGHIFENSLSEIEEVTAQINAGQATTPVSKRKRDGVFYTPQYITKYIVENTIGRLCAEKKAELGIDDNEYFADKNRQMATKKRLLDKLDTYREWLKQITICDPACGSGAFLNAALQFLMAEHKLLDDMVAKVAGYSIVYPDVENYILENNLFGVDINEESVEIARLALWLRTAKKCRKLSSLNNNIKCGNSLISDPEIAGDKAFNWQVEFPDVFAKGGFDVVIGNPPYVRVQNLKSTEVDYYFSTYKTPSGKLDISTLFIEKSLSLINENGIVSFISSSQWMQTDYGKNLRELLSEGWLYSILDFGSLPVFESADTYPAIFTIDKKNKGFVRYAKVPTKEDLVSDKLNAMTFQSFDCKDFSAAAWQFNAFNLVKSLQKNKIAFKLLKDIAPSVIGDLTGKDEAFVLTREKAESLGIENDVIYPYAYRGEEVKPFITVQPKAVVIYPYNNDGTLFSDEYFASTFPNAYKYLFEKKDELMQRMDSRKYYATEDNWFRHLRAGQYSYITPPKILLKGIGLSLQAGLLEKRSIFNGANVPAIVLPDIENYEMFLLCILNSRLITYYLTSICPPKLGGYYRFNSSNISSIPIVEPNDDQQPFFELANSMLALNKELQETRERFIRRLQSNIPEVKINGALEAFDSLDFSGFTNELKKQKIRLSLFEQDEWEKYFNKNKQDCDALSAQIAETDKEINARVYALYGLTDEEIKLIEQ
jgi:type I restriction-modification system DNA methylase subunit